MRRSLPHRLLPTTWYTGGVSGIIYWGACIAAMLLGVTGWALWDLLRDLAFRWRMRGYRACNWKPGSCLKCGYDVRANVERCSECGEPVATLRPPPRALKK